MVNHGVRRRALQAETGSLAGVLTAPLLGAAALGATQRAIGEALLPFPERTTTPPETRGFCKEDAPAAAAAAFTPHGMLGMVAGDVGGGTSHGLCAAEGTGGQGLVFTALPGRSLTLRAPGKLFLGC